MIANQQPFVTSHDIKEDFERKDVELSENTVRRRLKETVAKFSLPMSEPYAYGKASIKSFKMGTKKCGYKLGPSNFCQTKPLCA